MKSFKYLTFIISFLLIFSIVLVGSVDAEETIELQISRPGTPHEVRAFLEPAVEAFEEEYPHISVEILDMGWGEWYDRMIALLAAGEAPDVRMTALSVLTFFNDQGAYYPLTEFVENSPDLKERIFDELWEMSTIEGEILQVPTAAASFALFYRKDIFEEAGLDSPPNDLAEIAEYARIITENTDARGMGIHAGSNSQTVRLFNVLYGKDLITEDGKILFDEEEGIDTLEKIAELIGNNWTNPEPTSYPSRGDLRPMFRDGDVAMVVDGPWFLPMLREAGMLPEDEEESVVGITVKPLTAGDRSTGLGNDGWVIDKNTDHPEEAWKLIEFLTQPEWQLKHEVEYGLTPAQHATAEMEEYDLWYWGPFIEGLEDVYRWYFLNILETTAFEDIMIDGLQEAYMGFVSPEQAIEFITDELRRRIDEVE